jgi:hypothetical protein
MDLRKQDSIDCINLAQDRGQSWALGNTVMNLELGILPELSDSWLLKKDWIPQN